jgi:homoserine dehydrogenase
MDGAPVFNLVAETLPGCEVVGFSGVLNSTTNLLLTRMEQGASLDEALADARGRGIVEANPDHDIDGHDAAAKAAALVNVLMDGTVTPRDIPTIGIRRVTRDALDAEVQRGRRLRLVARAARRGDEIAVRVGPEALPEADALARLGGTSNALTLRTDLMGELTIVEHDPGIEQTAYALLSDLIAVGRAIGVRA